MDRQKAVAFCLTEADRLFSSTLDTEPCGYRTPSESGNYTDDGCYQAILG